MANCANLTKSVSVVLVILASGILMIQGGSISSVSVQHQDAEPVELDNSITKSLNLINLPQVPEFPRLSSRPGKHPSSSHALLLSNQNSQYANQHQPQYSQTTVQEVSNPVPSYTAPIVYQSVPQQEVEPVMYDNNLVDSEEDHQEDNQEDYVSENEPLQETSVDEIETTYQHYEQAAYSPITYEESVVNISAHTADIPEVAEVAEVANIHIPPQQPEKNQDMNPDFPVPMHVMSILNALGSGGSLAQATKPEKDGVNPGYTTANAVGYATGDNATVTASVSNKMELNTQTVILTESASASASSMSNGTAFSQATLASSNYANQFGGNGWKSNNKNPSVPVLP